MNNITIIGTVGQDPEIRYTPNGTAVAKFSVADNFKVKGEKKTNWWNVIGWGKLATDVIEPYVHKGDKIAIVGKGAFSSWEKDGQKHTKLEVTIGEIQLLGSSGAAAPARAPEGGVPEDDIPF